MVPSQRALIYSPSTFASRKKLQHTFEPLHDIGFVIALVELFERLESSVDHGHVVHNLRLCVEKQLGNLLPAPLGGTDGVNLPDKKKYYCALNEMRTMHWYLYDCMICTCHKSGEIPDVWRAFRTRKQCP